MSQGVNEIGRFYACTILGTLDLEYLTVLDNAQLLLEDVYKEFLRNVDFLVLFKLSKD